MHWALLHAQTAKYYGCNEFVHCCMPRPQSIVVQIASMANTRMLLSHSWHLQCHLKMRYIHGALRSGYATKRNAQCINSEDNLFFNYVYKLAHIVTFEKKIEENISFRFSKSVLRITFCEFSAVGTLSEQTNCYHSTAKTDTDGQDANLPFVNGRCHLE